LRGAVLVTIPSEESKQSVLRAANAAHAAGIPLLGIVENMAGYICPGCSAVQPLFPGSAGQELSTMLGLPLLASVPMNPSSTPDHDSGDLVQRFREVIA